MHPVSPAIGSTAWIKSSYSGAEYSECVEVLFLPGSTALRDSKQPTESMILFGKGAWRTFLEELQNGRA
ncbi:DUF397 domain-containing protein [Streptomyces sp. NPDC051567]|uniref:DUF397 domain-containing protein n=1 Tax=Streptomyces sp. NPDC051567 TaxID=3365660 RepID=UPI00378FDF94